MYTGERTSDVHDVCGKQPAHPRTEPSDQVLPVIRTSALGN